MFPLEPQPQRSWPPDWAANDAAAADWSFLAFCPIACVPPAAQRQSPPRWSWSAFWPVRLTFSAVAFESTLFDWETSPSSPLLPTRTGVFVLLAPD